MSLQEVIQEDPFMDRRHPSHFQNVWTMGNILNTLISLGTLVILTWGGLSFAARLDSSTKEIPELIRVKNEQAREIAVLQDQQHYADSRYAEIMLQLARINAKLDKQNEYLYDSLSRPKRQ